jgi:L-lactate dehydrogenase complex protein LldG
VSDAARQSVLGAIRHHLASARSREVMPPSRDALGDAPEALPAVEGVEDCLVRFSERLAAVGGRAWRVRGLEGAREAVVGILAEAGVTRLVVSDAERVAAVLPGIESSVEGLSILDRRDRAQLFAAEAGLSTAQWAIAETGSLVLVSSEERHRLVSLVPPLHIALVPTSALLPTMAEGLRRVAASGPASAITWVTGPSRTADIELTLVVGVHGPRALHVVFVDED